jgi:hypothetical protein
LRKDRHQAAESKSEAAPADTAPREKPQRKERRRSEKPARQEHAPAPKAAKHAPVPIRAHETQAERERREDAPRALQKGQGAAGLGDHVPAFLLKPVPEKIFKTPTKKPETV